MAAVTELVTQLMSFFSHHVLMLQRIYIPLPEEQARSDMFRVQLEGVRHSLAPGDFRLFAVRTHGFSGSDIADVAQDAIMQPFRLTQSAPFFR